jgi:hypothetical protein
VATKYYCRGSKKLKCFDKNIKERGRERKGGGKEEEERRESEREREREREGEGGERTERRDEIEKGRSKYKLILTNLKL